MYKDEDGIETGDSEPLMSIKIGDLMTTIRMNLNLEEYRLKGEEELKHIRDSGSGQLFHFEAV